MSSGRKAAGIVSLAVVGSRVFGLVREMTFAAMFGAGRHLDSFLAAFQVPNLFRDLFAEGALSTAFTTVFAKTHEKEGDEASWRLANLLFSTVILIGGAACLIGIAACPIIVEITSHGFHQIPGKFEMTVQLTRILFPFILFVSIAAAVMGILNARSIFGLPASASTVFNIVSVAAGAGLAFLFDPQWNRPERAMYGVALGVLIGGMAQLGIQLPALWRLGHRFRWSLNFADPGLREIWRLMGPSLIAGAAVQVNVLVNGMFASEIDGARTWLSCAFRLMHFPIGVFGVAIATVTLPAIARHHARNDLAAFGRTVEESLRLAFFLTVPAAVGLCVLAPDIIRVIYQHGQFTAEATAKTAWALRAYSIGLAGYAASRVLIPCFSALGQPMKPLRVSLLAIGINLALNFTLIKWFGMGHIGLALTTSLVALLNFGQLVFLLRREVSLGQAGNWIRLIASVVVGAALCGTAAWEVVLLASPLAEHSLPAQIGIVGGAVLLGGLIYFWITFAMRTPEARSMLTAAGGILRKTLTRDEG